MFIVKRVFLACALTFMALAFTSNTASAAKYTLKIGIVPRNEPLHEYSKLFKEELEKLSNGEISVKIYPGAQLGNGFRLVESVQLGTVEMFIGPPSFYKGINPAFQATDAPGQFLSMDHAAATLQDPMFREKFVHLGEDKGILGVGLFPYSPVSYATYKQVSSVEDLKGLKIRVISSEVETAMAEALGATGVPLPLAETVPSLQRKIVDGVRTSAGVMAALKVNAVAKNLFVTRDSMIVCMAILSKKFYDKLPANLQAVVIEAGKKAETRLHDYTKKFDDKVLNIWKKSGATVVQINDTEKADLLKKGAMVAERVLGNDPEIKDMYALLKTSAAKHAP